MNKLDLGIMSTPDGVGLIVQRNGQGDDIFVPVPLERAIAFMMDWWKALSVHYPLVQNPDPDAIELPMFLVTGDFRHRTEPMVDGLVRLMLQPYETAGIGFEMKPDEAREMARYLLEAADMIDAHQTPN